MAQVKYVRAQLNVYESLRQQDRLKENRRAKRLWKRNLRKQSSIDVALADVREQLARRDDRARAKDRALARLIARRP